VALSFDPCGIKLIKKSQMKKIKAAVIILLSSAALVAFAQAVKDVNSSVGNGAMMKENLNFPNATIPARFNIQGYERDGRVQDMNNHPDKDLANSFNRAYYQK
jgi:hypothetical protein